MIFGCFGWIFDAEVFAHDPLQNICWLIYIQIRVVLIYWLCVGSKDMVGCTVNMVLSMGINVYSIHFQMQMNLK